MDFIHLLPKGPLTPLLIAGTFTTLSLVIIIKFDTIAIESVILRFLGGKKSKSDVHLQEQEEN